MGDAKQPALEIIHFCAQGSRVKGLHEGILQYVLSPWTADPVIRAQ